MKNLDLFQNKLNSTTANIKLISDNLANINTPNYKRKFIDVHGSSNDFQLELNKTLQKHQDKRKNTSTSAQSGEFTIRTDGNGVDTDMEVVEMNKNILFHNSMLRLLNGNIQSKKNIIEGR